MRAVAVQVGFFDPQAFRDGTFSQLVMEDGQKCDTHYEPNHLDEVEKSEVSKGATVYMQHKLVVIKCEVEVETPGNPECVIGELCEEEQ